MRKIIFIAFLLLSYISFAQGGPLVDVIKFRGEVTTTIRNTFDVPVGENWIIYNTTTGQYEESGSDDVWQTFGGGGTGDVTGPASSTDNSIARFDGVSGKLLQGSQITITDVGNLDLNNNEIQSVTNITSGSAEVGSLTIVGASNQQSGTAFTWNGNNTYVTNEINTFRWSPTDIESTGLEGTVYADDSENRPKYYDGTSWKAFLLDGDAAGTDSQTLSLSGTDLSISNGNTVDLSGLGGTGDANPDVLYVNRNSGDVTNAWADSLNSKIINYHTSIEGVSYHNIPSSFDTYKRVVINPIVKTDAAMVFTSDHYAFRGNGAEFINSIPPNPTSGFVGVYVDSSNVASFSRITPLSNALAWSGFFKPYQISQVSGVAADNVTATGFDLSWDAATASVGTISNYQYSIDGGTPVAVNGATNASVTGLTASTTYNVNVRAVDAGGNVGQYSGDVEVITASSCTPLANNVYTATDAASDPNCNESNAVASGWNGFNSNATVATTTDSTTGTHAIRGNLTAGSAAGYISYRFAVTSGDTYTVTFDSKAETTGAPRLTAWQGVTGGPSSVALTSTYVTYTYNITASSTTTVELRFYISANASSTINDGIFIDNFSIVSTN